MGPLISVLIPTRGRPDLLPQAVQSALDQDYDNIEIVISDNSTNSATTEACGWYRDPRVRYCRVPRDLTMMNNFGYAFAQARGAYCVYICDDDALAAGAISTAVGLLREHDAEIVVWDNLAYYDAELSTVPARRNSLLVRPFTGECRVFDSRDLIAQLYAGRLTARIPQFENCLMPSERLRRLYATLPDDFTAYAADVALAAMMLDGVRRCLDVSLGLTLFRIWAESFSTKNVQRSAAPVAAIDRLAGLEDYYREFDIPLRELRLNASRAYGNKLFALARSGESGHLRPSLAGYLMDCYHEIRNARTGAALAESVAAFDGCLAGQDADVRRAVADAVERHESTSLRSRARRAIRSAIDGNRTLSRIESRLRPSKQKSYLVRGADHGFRDILGAARAAPAIVTGVAANRPGDMTYELVDYEI